MHIVGVAIGLVLIFLALQGLRAAFRAFGQDSCLAGCCLFEISDWLLELGCSLAGCGGVLCLAALPVMLRLGWLHW